jgi:hypothetical protein
VPRERIEIVIFDGSPRSFDARIDLTGCDLPGEAEVIVEAGCAGSNVIPRFAWGTVNELMPPANRILSGLFGENVFFSLKVIDRRQQFGRILGLAEHIRPVKGGKKTPTGRRGILPIESADLGPEPWKLDFRTEDVYLLINSRVPDLKDRMRHDAGVFGLVYPVVVRQILSSALKTEFEDDEASEHWASQWLNFGTKLHSGGVKPPSHESEADREEWVNDIVESFCRKHDLLQKLSQKLTGSSLEELV